MPSWTERFVRQPLRRALLQVLSWTEKTEPAPPRAQKMSAWRREVRLPTWLMAGIVHVFFVGALLIELGIFGLHVVSVVLLTGLAMGLFIFYVRKEHADIASDEEAVMLLGVIAVGAEVLMMLWLRFTDNLPPFAAFGVPLATASLLTALLLKSRLSIILSTVLCLICGLLNNYSLPVTLVTFFGCMTAVAAASMVRTRKDVTRAGLWIAFSQSLAALSMGLLRGWPWEGTLMALAWTSGAGLLSSLLTLSVLPSLENFFSRLTNLKLLELSDVNHPLLRRLSLEAPGTYHHSMVMASLAQAAAESIGANGLLCRVGAYFHDIGKLVKPEYFIENQGAMGNPHDPLVPNMSRLVIQSHVKEGLAFAQQYGLDKAIADFIPMHHGTSRIEYFYRRAVSQSDEEVGEDEYRYPGPKPHSKETAIIMLADSVEASARTLDEPTHQRLQDQVQKIINIKMNDGQFSDVPLTLAEINAISESFVNTLTGVYHSRIAYPEAAAASKPQ